jgi:anti-sigma factor RsiW
MVRVLEQIPSYPEGEPLEVRLSAYLDGELDEVASLEVERLLETDPEARRLLRELEETWGMLDVLERSGADAAFTRTTLEMVAVAAEQEVARQRRERPWRLGAQIALGLAAVAAAALGGFFSTAWSYRSNQRQLLRDLPLLQNLERYEQIGQREFLELLDRMGVFASEDKAAGDAP